MNDQRASRAANGDIDRMLVLLHESALDTIQNCEIEGDHQRRGISYAGLDMMCRMTVEVAQWHGEEERAAQIKPICCYYNLWAARERLQERNRLDKDEAVSRDIHNLLRAEEKYRETWVF